MRERGRIGAVVRRSTLAILLLAAAANDGYERIAAQTPDERAVLDALESGAYEKAVEFGATLVREQEAASGAQSPQVARASDLLVEALTKAGKAADDRTVARAEHAVQLKERIFGTDHFEISASLHNLGAVRVERGEFATAISLHERALSIRSRSLRQDDPAIADSLDYLALPLIRLQRFDEARRHLERSLNVRETLAERAPRALARTLELVALLHRYSGTYRSAPPLLDRALAIRHQLGLDTHPETISILTLQGDILYLDGDIVRAQRVWIETVGLAERTLGPAHPAVAPLLRRMGAAAETLGDLGRKRELLDRALQISNASMAPCHPETAGILNDLANSARYFGSYLEARQLYNRALTIREKCLGHNHSLTATIIFNEAELAASSGDFGEAERLYQSATRVWSAALGPNHPYVALGLDGLAQVLTSRGQLVRARGLYERALAIRRQSLGADHPDVAWTMTNLARTIAALGDTALARTDVNRAIEIYRRTGASVEPDQLARMLRLRGQLEMKQREYATARATFEEALSARERIFGNGHPLSAEARADRASANLALGSYQAALDDALGAEQTGRDHLRFTVRYLPERQGLLYAANRPRGLDLALSVVAAGQAVDASAVFDAVIRSRAIVLDELANRAAAAVADPAIAPAQQAAAATRQRFANLMLRSLLGDESVPRSLLDQARTEKEASERALAEQSSAERAEQTRAAAGLDDLRVALPPQSALVSFVRYDRTSSQGSSAGRRLATTPVYLAFVTRADASSVAAVPLGSATAIDGLIRTWRSEVLKGAAAAEDPAIGMQSYRAAGTTLRQRLWDPLAQHLDRVEKVFVVPDGSISLVAFDALPVNGNKYLVETGRTIHYLPAERDLVDRDETSQRGTGLLAIGGAAFDSSPSARATRTATTRSGCATLQNLRFDPLPGTRREIAEIAAVWKTAAGPSEVQSTLLAGQDASESRFKQQAPGHRILHIATHGFFLGNDCAPAVAGARSVGGLATRAQLSAAVPADNPLILSGLAMAGANRRRAAGTDRDDGILTAEEVTALNLRGVEWAVLSACDTGLGEVKAGEGVLGLRRAFQIAGARTIIMSLWAVDDDAVRTWMHGLYVGRLQRRLNTADAMHQASLDALRERRAQGSSTHPFYWAGFVAAGDWR
jgi:CHAT domain-containing protein